MKKILAMMLVLCMVVNMLPVFALAEGTEPEGKIWIAGDENTTYASLHEAIDAAQDEETAVIILEGTVVYDKTTSDRCGVCSYYNEIPVRNDLTILGKAGSSATVIFDNTISIGRGIVISHEGKLTLGSAEEGAGKLVFDGGAKWGSNPARWDKAKDSTYNTGSVRNGPLFRLDRETKEFYYPEHGYEDTMGAELVLNRNVTIQNYVNAASDFYGVIYAGTNIHKAMQEEEGRDVIVRVDGTLKNNASKHGGAICMSSGDLYIEENAVLSGNSADAGGAICAYVDDDASALPVNVTINGGVLENNSAFAGGAIAAWPKTIDADETLNEELPSVMITMNDGVIKNNTAHTWVPERLESSGLTLNYGIGGGGVMLAAREAHFTMKNGEISSNRTFEQTINIGTEEDPEYYLMCPEVGHAISAVGLTYGENLITLDGGKIKNNGTGSGTVIEARQDLVLYKFILLLLLLMEAKIDDIAKLPVEIPIINRLVPIYDETLSETARAVMLLDILRSTSMEEMYDLFFTLGPYVNDGDGDSGFDENHDLHINIDMDSALENVAMLKKAGVGDDQMSLLVNHSSVIGAGQTVGVGADAYVHFAANPDVSVPVQVFPSVTVGTKIISYEKNVNLTDQVDFKVVNDSPKLGVEHIGNAYFITGYYEGEQPPVTRTYTATFKMKDKQLVWKNVSSIVLPTADKLNGWDIPDKFADQLCWSYQEHGATLTVPAGSTFYLKRDTIFTASFANSGNANVTVDFNGGKLGDDTSLTDEYPMGAEVQGDLITGLFANLTPPEDGRVIPVGLTEEQVKGIVESDPGVPVYNTASLMQESYCVNPYIIFENPTTVYVLWAYDKNKNNIPDYLEVEVKIHPNGGMIEGTEIDEPVTVVSLPKGDILSMMTIASLKNILTHEKVEEKPVYLLGLTESDAVLDKIYSKENSLPVGLKLYGPDPQENYVVTGDVTFYAVWSLDRDIEVPVPDPDPDPDPDPNPDPDPDPNPNPNPNPVPSQPVISTPAHKCPAKEFVDVNINLWYHEALDYVLNEGLMNGVGGKKFDPNGATTRAMIVTILWRQEGEPAVNYNMTFADVAKDTWYTEAVRWAASVGVVEGYSDTAFGPMDKITREQLATILWRYAKYKGCDVSVGENTNILSYDDALDISEWAMPAMQWACGEGVMRGKGGGLLDPSGLATRAEVAQMLLNYFE